MRFWLLLAIVSFFLLWPGTMSATTPTPIPTLEPYRPIANQVVKRYCDFAFNYSSSTAAKETLLNEAKRLANVDLFGEYINAFTQVENFVVTADQIRTLSTGFMRIGDTVYENGEGWGEVCVIVEAYVLPEDRQMFEPQTSLGEECVTDGSLTLAALTAGAEELAFLQALSRYDRRLSALDPTLLTQSFRRVRYFDGAVRGTNTYCVSAEVEIAPIVVNLLLIGPTPTSTATPSPTATSTAIPTFTPTFTPTSPTTPTPLAGATRINPIDGAVYVYVPAGAFLMGSDGGDSDEQPVHRVTLDAFWIMQTEVTNAQYAQCVRASVCTAPNNRIWDDNDRADHPVTHVESSQARQYTAWVSGNLPTEAQWEMACRGTDNRIYPWGNIRPNAELLNFDRNVEETSATGSFLAGASPFGVLDMAGNVWELTADWYSNSYYSRSPEHNPTGPDSGRGPSLRGGSYIDAEGGVRCTNRLQQLSVGAHPTIGFRVVQNPGFE